MAGGTKSKGKRTPAVEASGAGNGGIVPPVEHRWKPGQSGNPGGSRSAGAYIQEHLNVLAAGDLTEIELRTIARDKRMPWTKRAAAERILRTLEAGDIADMEPILDGTKTLAELRESGVNTEVIRKVKTKTRILPGADGKDGATEIEREIELHDRAGADVDRIMDRTLGKPSQAIDITSKGNEIYLKDIRGVSHADL